MTRLAANLSMLFSELPFLDRIDAAAAAGFDGVEWMFSYEVPAEQVRDRLDRNGLTSVLINMPAGDWSAGERGLAGLPGRREEFEAGMALARDYALVLDCQRIHVMAGLCPDPAERPAYIETYVSSLQYAADCLAGTGIEVMIEPINRKHDMPGYLVAGSDEGVAMLERIGRDNVRLQYDIYHMQITEGDLLRTIQRLLPYIGHIQIADNPGRNEPGTGEIAFERLLPAIDALGYAGWIGCEYRPRSSTTEGLGWASNFLEPAR